MKQLKPKSFNSDLKFFIAGCILSLVAESSYSGGGLGTGSACFAGNCTIIASTALNCTDKPVRVCVEPQNCADIACRTKCTDLDSKHHYKLMLRENMELTVKINNNDHSITDRIDTGRRAAGSEICLKITTERNSLKADYAPSQCTC